MTNPHESSKDYYQVLGIRPTATPEQVEAAYRDMARRWHPDVSSDAGQAAEEFKAACEAHEVLGDPQRRRRYDRQLAAKRASAQGSPVRQAKAATPQPPVAPVGAWATASFAEALDDLLRSGLAGLQKKTPAAATASIPGDLDVEAALFITPEEARYGTVCEISLSYDEPCRSCSRPSAAAVTFCVSCQGTGRVRRPLGPLAVHVPAGIRNGSVVVVAGQGKSACGSAHRGDLHLRIRVRPCW